MPWGGHGLTAQLRNRVRLTFAPIGGRSLDARNTRGRMSHGGRFALALVDVHEVTLTKTTFNYNKQNENECRFHFGAVAPRPNLCSKPVSERFWLVVLPPSPADQKQPEQCRSERRVVCGARAGHAAAAAILNDEHAVGLRREILPFLLERSKRMEMPYDIGPLSAAVRANKTRNFIIYPNIAIQDMADSDISSSTYQERARLEQVFDQYRWDIDDYEF